MRVSRVAVLSAKAAGVTRMLEKTGFSVVSSISDASMRQLRGPGRVLAGNDVRKLIVPSGGNIKFRRSLQSARFVALR